MLATIQHFCASYTWKKLFLLFVVAFVIRATVFFAYIQHQERYHQADSMDYHACALSLYYGKGLRRFDNNWPVFWRTPGYPLYLAFFYTLCGVSKPQFNENSFPHKVALWVQIFLSSFTPILIFFLVLSLVAIIPLAWFIAWFFVFHLGFVLASGYLLTESLAVMLFFLYLIFLYKKYHIIGESDSAIPPYWHIVLSALFLGAYTWMRPMGQFMALITLLILAIANIPFKRKLLYILLFAAIFLGSITPWIIRNYRYTGKIFFWPGSGSYLISFNVPKILRHVTGKPLGECHQQMMKEASKAVVQEYLQLKKEKPGYFVSQELVCAKLSWPWILKHPWYFMRDWMQEVCKSTFDLYANQLVHFARNTYTFDPLEEFLSEKLADCLYKYPLPFFMRFLCLFEALISLGMWIGIFLGFMLFFLQPLFYKLKVNSFKKRLFFAWLKAGIIIVAVLGMTGGFGYARLRMPVEPLLMLLSMTFWYYFWYKEFYKER